MNELITAYAHTGTLHHAYVVEGDIESAHDALRAFFEAQVGFSTQGNPDFVRIAYDSFGIDDGRFLKELQLKRAFGEAGMKVFVISCNAITVEAQNALLKVFEEPTEGTHFFLLVPSADMLLPTVHSRVCMLAHHGNKTQTGFDVQKFLSVSPARRLSLCEDIVESKDRQGARGVVDALLRHLYTLWDRSDASYARILADVEQCRRYLSDKSSSVKMILEHLSLTLPNISARSRTRE